MAQYAETSPQTANAAWPGHPQSELWSGLTQIGLTARERKPVPPSAFALIRDAARKSPLEAQPFVVRGVQAQVAGDRELAIAAFRAATLRDGRSIPARYFLAEQYLRSGDASGGLKQIAVLARMVPNGVDSLGPYIAAYAKDPRSRPQIRSLFRSDPEIEQAALTALAADAANAELIMQIATPRGKPPQWSARLVESLVNSGQYQKARAIWAQLSHVSLSSSDLVFDAGFRRPDAPGPFNWILISSAAGLAERQPNGRLHVLFYGQRDGVLARQMLVLPPGRYRLAMRVTGDIAHAAALTWTINCGHSGSTIATLPVARASRGTVFTVPSNCEGQDLQLVGSAPDLPQQVDLTISDFSLMPGGRNG